MVVGEPFAEVDDHRSHLAEHSGIENLADHIELRCEQGPHRLGAVQVELGGAGLEFARLPSIERERLLDQEMLPGVKREQSVRQVTGMGVAT
jgi:hypothetical protein